MKLKHDIDVKRVLDGPTRVSSPYGDVVVPVGHFVAMIGEGKAAFVFPPEAASGLFDLTAAQRKEWGLPKDDDEEATTKFVNTAVGEAVIGVAGDFPPERTDTLPQAPDVGIGPGAQTVVGEPPLTEEPKPKPKPKKKKTTKAKAKTPPKPSAPSTSASSRMSITPPASTSSTPHTPSTAEWPPKK